MVRRAVGVTSNRVMRSNYQAQRSTSEPNHDYLQVPRIDFHAAIREPGRYVDTGEYQADTDEVK